MDKNNKKFAYKDNSKDENNIKNNFHFIINVGDESSNEESLNEKNIQNEETEAAGNNLDMERRHPNIADTSNDIKTEKNEDNAIEEREKKEEISKIENKLIYPIFKLNNSDKEESKYYLNL